MTDEEFIEACRARHLTAEKLVDNVTRQPVWRVQKTVAAVRLVTVETVEHVDPRINLSGMVDDLLTQTIRSAVA